MIQSVHLACDLPATVKTGKFFFTSKDIIEPTYLEEYSSVIRPTS